MNRRTAFIAIASMIALAVWGCSKQEQGAEAHAAHEHGEHVAMTAMAGDTTLVYTCPHHPDVAEHKPGECSACGTLLVLKDAPEGTKYVCPTHSDVSQDAPGRCPECKMFLVAKPPAQPSSPATAGSGM